MSVDAENLRAVSLLHAAASDAMADGHELHVRAFELDVSASRRWRAQKLKCHRELAIEHRDIARMFREIAQR